MMVVMTMATMGMLEVVGAVVETVVSVAVAGEATVVGTAISKDQVDIMTKALSLFEAEVCHQFLLMFHMDFLPLILN